MSLEEIEKKIEVEISKRVLEKNKFIIEKNEIDRQYDIKRRDYRINVLNKISNCGKIYVYYVDDYVDDYVD